MSTPITIPEFSGTIRTDDDARAVYAEAAGIMRIMPRSVAVPANAEDVCALVRWAQQTRTPLIPRGSGSSMAGGAIGDGMIVDVSQMRALGAVDAHTQSVHAEPGVLRNAIDDAANVVGLRFPPNPSSGAFCTIGGMIATNAAGSHSVKYGPTRPWVRALDCVFDDGSRATIRRGEPLPTGISALDRFRAIADSLRTQELRHPSIRPGIYKNSSGYDVHDYAQQGELIDLLVGSEGTLAIVVGAELALTELPQTTRTIIVVFDRFEAAIDCALAMRHEGVTSCELLDQTFLDVTNARQYVSFLDIPATTQAILLIEVDGDSEAHALHRVREIAEAMTGFQPTTTHLIVTADEMQAMWRVRHAASPMLAALGPSHVSMQFIEDGSVPHQHMPTYVRAIRRLFEQHHIPGVIFGHAGDSHVHVNPLIDLRRSDWHEVIGQILRSVTELTFALGGTLSGEHGDGRLRTPLLDWVWPPTALTAFRAVKEAFDPAGIFNPGVKVPLPGQQAITDIKYDPTLPPLPASAAAALATVARERAYHKFRLDLLAGSA